MTDLAGKSPRCVFRTIGCITFIAHRWMDKAKARAFNEKLCSRQQCEHEVKFCSCIEHLFNDPARNRHFPITYAPELLENSTFLQASTEQQHRVTLIGTLVATVICANTSMSLSLPKEMSQFNVTTITWTDLFAYCMTGRKIRWTGYAEPSHHVIRQLIGISSLIQFLIKSSHNLLGCNKG